MQESTFLLPLVRVAILAAHLIAANVAAAGPLICVWLRFRARRGDATADAVGRKLARLSVWALWIAIMLGLWLIALLWAANDTRYWSAVQRFPRQAFGFAAIELAFTGVCLGTYAVTWDRLRGRPSLHALLALLGTTNLLYHVPPLMIALGQLAAQPEWVHEPLITRSVFRGLLLKPELLSRLIHFTIACAAIGGVALMLLAHRLNGTAGDESAANRLTTRGARIAFSATLIQFVAGIWLLWQLPPLERNALFGNDWVACTLFVLSLVAVFGVLHALAGVALGDTSGGAVRRGTTVLIVVIVMMTAAQTRLRQVTAAADVRPQLGSLKDATFRITARRSSDVHPIVKVCTGTGI